MTDATGRVLVPPSIGSDGVTKTDVVRVTNEIPVGVTPLIQTVLPDGSTVYTYGSVSLEAPRVT